MRNDTGCMGWMFEVSPAGSVPEDRFEKLFVVGDYQGTCGLVPGNPTLSGFREDCFRGWGDALGSKVEVVGGVGFVEGRVGGIVSPGKFSLWR